MQRTERGFKQLSLSLSPHGEQDSDSFIFVRPQIHGSEPHQSPANHAGPLTPHHDTLTLL